MDSKAWSGIGLGNAMAAIISFSSWHSILWMLWHGWCGYFYVIYFVIRYRLIGVL